MAAISLVCVYLIIRELRKANKNFNHIKKRLDALEKKVHEVRHAHPNEMNSTTKLEAEALKEFLYKNDTEKVEQKKEEDKKIIENPQTLHPSEDDDFCNYVVDKMTDAQIDQMFSIKKTPEENIRNNSKFDASNINFRNIHLNTDNNTDVQQKKEVIDLGDYENMQEVDLDSLEQVNQGELSNQQLSEEKIYTDNQENIPEFSLDEEDEDNINESEIILDDNLNKNTDHSEYSRENETTLDDMMLDEEIISDEDDNINNITIENQLNKNNIFNINDDIDKCKISELRQIAMKCGISVYSVNIDGSKGKLIKKGVLKDKIKLFLGQ